MSFEGAKEHEKEQIEKWKENQKSVVVWNPTIGRVLRRRREFSIAPNAADRSRKRTENQVLNLAT